MYFAASCFLCCPTPYSNNT